MAKKDAFFFFEPVFRTRGAQRHESSSVQVVQRSAVVEAGEARPWFSVGVLGLCCPSCCSRLDWPPRLQPEAYLPGVPSLRNYRVLSFCGPAFPPFLITGSQGGVFSGDWPVSALAAACARLLSSGFCEFAPRVCPQSIPCCCWWALGGSCSRSRSLTVDPVPVTQETAVCSYRLFTWPGMIVSLGWDVWEGDLLGCRLGWFVSRGLWYLLQRNNFQLILVLSRFLRWRFGYKINFIDFSLVLFYVKLARKIFALKLLLMATLEMTIVGSRIFAFIGSHFFLPLWPCHAKRVVSGPAC